ncbi:MAG: ABC transporter substrate-binding protein [Chloroflexi bacterium]|nr:ABC transporter substrate-binding protein [Chloroflexota bacterium]
MANDNDMRKTVLGSGAFKFKSYTSGVGWELVKNPDYFVKDRPYLDGVKGYIIKDSFARFAALRTRNILWWAPFPMMSVSQTKIIEQQLSDKIALKWEFHPAWYGVIFNLNQAPWSDVRVRQAISLAFDRKRMVATGLEGAGIIGMSAQPPGEWALPEEEMVKVAGYAKPDIEGAKRLLAEAGFPNGFQSEMLVRAVKSHEDTGVVIKDAAAAIGIDLDLKVRETAVYQDTQYKKAFGIAEGGVSSKVQDPDVTLGDFYLSKAGRNWTGYSNPYYDELHAKQSRTIDAAERRKIVWEMQRVLFRDVPIAIVYWVKAPYVWWREVRGFTPPVEFSNAYAYQEMWLAK